MTERKLVLTLAEADGLDRWLSQLQAWYANPATHLSSAGQNIVIRQGSQEMYGWRITDLKIGEADD